MLQFTIEQVDELMKQTGASYEEAKALLEEFEGDVDQARLVYEERHKGFDANQLDDVVKFIKNLFDEGLAARLVVRKNDEVIMNIPAGFSLLGLVKLPLTAAVLGGVLLTGHKVSVEKKDGSIIDINEYAEKATEDVKKAGQSFYGQIQEVFEKKDLEDMADETDIEDELDDEIK